MSSLDQYSLCPCGNGKKIKFCKCSEHLAEMQEIHRMIVGEQNVAALDRINVLLKTMPSEPWLLAMKCDLLLQLRELEPLEETSAKFIRLQPDNPLAKLYRSLVAIIRGNTEDAANLLLQSIADSGEQIHPMTLTVAMNLLEFLGQRRKMLPAILLCEMLLDMDENTQSVAMEAYESLITRAQESSLQRESLPSIIDYDDAPFAERLAEAEALVTAHRISGAKTKLESMLREFGPQPAILQTLLHCQLILTDEESAAGTCNKLAAASSLPESQRIYYQALAYELAPASYGITIREEVVVYSIEDAETEQRIASCKSLMEVKVDELRPILDALLQEEVPPKSAFGLIAPVTESDSSEAYVSRQGTWMAYYGKQTDKPARVVLLEAFDGYRQELCAKVKSELGLDGLKRELIESFPVLFYSRGMNPLIATKQITEERQASIKDLAKTLMTDEVLNLKLDCLGSKSILESAGTSENRLSLQALLLLWQSENMGSLDDADFRNLHKRLQVSSPSLPSSSDVFDTVGGAAYYWTDLATIDPQSLVQLMQSALTRGVTSMYSAYIAKAEATQWPEELKLSAEYTLLNLKLRISGDAAEAEKVLARIIEAGKKLGVPVGNAVLERFEILSMLGRQGEARQFLESSLRENPNDPALLRFVQMAMMQQRQMAARSGGAGGIISDPTGGNTDPSSGLWTPDSGNSGPSGSGGSKLWTPD